MHNWYWACASAGPYSIIASHITATPAFGDETQIVYMLARVGKIIADDDAKVTFERDRVAIDGKTGKPVADVTRYIYRNAGTRYVVSFKRGPFCGNSYRPGAVPEADHRPAGRLDGAYHRSPAR